MRTIYAVPGIGEIQSAKPRGILKEFCDGFPASSFVSEQFNYRNEYGPVPRPNGQAYDVNLVDAVRSLAQKIRDCPNRVVLTGHSAGAHVISILLEQMAAGQHKDLVIDGVVLFANPLRAKSDSAAPGYGIAGQHGPWPKSIPVVDVANPADIICCCEEFSPMRGFADVTKSFSFTDSVGWATRFFMAAVTGKNQAWFNPRARGSFGRAIVGVQGYMGGVAHGSWYVSSGAAKRAVGQLRAVARI